MMQEMDEKKKKWYATAQEEIEKAMVRQKEYDEARKALEDYKKAFGSRKKK